MPKILTSNIFLLVPTIIAWAKGEWLYLAFCLGLCVASPMYHYLSLYNRKSRLFVFARTADWVVGIGAHAYMYYFIFNKVGGEWQMPLATLLSLTILFFIYGFKFGSYKKLHPRYHVFVFLTSGLIVFMGA